MAHGGVETVDLSHLSGRGVADLHRAKLQSEVVLLIVLVELVWWHVGDSAHKPPPTRHIKRRKR
jgi:hypothetical protein